MMTFNLKIKEYLKKILNNGLKKEKWDCVVLTARDDEQKEAFEEQLQELNKISNLVLSHEFRVFADPPGPKVGSGGAIMNSLKQLKSIFEEKLFEKRILFLNAGGLSQRLPSSSALGKIFMALPLPPPLDNLFNLKIFLYTPFLERMKPGIFHASSDTIECFWLDDDQNWSLDKKNFTALAHPSPLHIGTNHGVFVVEEWKNKEPMEFLKCKNVLQKPTLEELKEKKAILLGDKNEPLVLTDSTFYFDHSFSKKLIQFYEQVEPLQCEVDAYGDFMKSLVSSEDFFQNLSNFSPHVIETRKKLSIFLKDCQFHVLSINQSLFFHLGTMSELLDNINPFSNLGECLGFQGDISNKSISCDKNKSSVLINNYFQAPVTIGDRVLIEFCQFKCPVTIGPNTILSNCCLGEKDEVVFIPSNIFLHTVALKSDETSSTFSTIIFGLMDDIKKIFKEKIFLFGKPVKSQNLILFHNNIRNLWHAQLFVTKETREESMEAALKLGKGEWEKPKTPLFSASQLMEKKDIGKMINYQIKLKQLIKK